MASPVKNAKANLLEYEYYSKKDLSRRSSPIYQNNRFKQPLEKNNPPRTSSMPRPMPLRFSRRSSGTVIRTPAKWAYLLYISKISFIFLLNLRRKRKVDIELLDSKVSIRSRCPIFPVLLNSVFGFSAGKFFEKHSFPLVIKFRAWKSITSCDLD